MHKSPRLHPQHNKNKYVSKTKTISLETKKWVELGQAVPSPALSQVPLLDNLDLSLVLLA